MTLAIYFFYIFSSFIEKYLTYITIKIYSVLFAMVGCMRQALGPGALGRPRGSGWRGRWEGDRDGEHM